MRKTIKMKSIFGDLKDLHNESDVEQLFVRRLLDVLDYPDSAVRSKASLSSLVVGGLRGVKYQNYKPDFALKSGSEFFCIIEAKHPNEKLNDHFWQPAAYCRLLNGNYKGSNPTKYFVLTNGVETRVYDWDRNESTVQLYYDEFQNGNEKFNELISILKFGQRKQDKENTSETIELIKKPLKDVNAEFAWCHQYIYKKDNIGQSDAFSEFVKLIALKLISDRDIKNMYPSVLVENIISVPKEKVKFSVDFIERNQQLTSNPIDSIQYQSFLKDMERDIVKKVRKRIFDSNDRIRLKPETIEGVVRKLENTFLFGIDADLNGRLFETFLNATMRGKDLGQFFTPRSLVKLGVKLANPKVFYKDSNGDRRSDIILDACSGTGGFLIDLLSAMWDKVDNLKNLSQAKRQEVKKDIANSSLIGIDVSSGPNLSRVARLNMYLHGDGGTRIYHVDALDTDVTEEESDSGEKITEKAELRELLKGGNVVDIVLTNPPFAKVYEREVESEDKILDKYQLGFTDDKKKRKSVKSGLLFIERYHSLLKPGGRMVAIIDDGILSGKDYKWFRKYLLNKFDVKAVISLPGDAFQRSKARVKTSYLVADKRREGDVYQSPVFMYACKHVGIDDSARQRQLPIDEVNRKLAKKEIEEVIKEFRDFENGIGNDKYIVDLGSSSNRLDVKNRLMKTGRSVIGWEKNNFTVHKVRDILHEKIETDENVIYTKGNDDFVTMMIVRYDGSTDLGDEIVASDSSYSKLRIVSTGDVVISNIAASHGSIAVVPLEYDGCVVSNEYTILETKDGFNPIVVQLMMRSPELRADILLSATGINRTRTKWALIKNLPIPYPHEDLEIRVINFIENSIAARLESERLYKNGVKELEDQFGLNNDIANDILAAFKPPK